MFATGQPLYCRRVYSAGFSMSCSPLVGSPASTRSSKKTSPLPAAALCQNGGSSGSHYNGNEETCMNIGEAMGRAMVEPLKK